jgi:hypothetical protein
VAHAQPVDAVATLKSLIPAGELVWFVAEAKSQGKENGNFWLYESTMETIVPVLQCVQPFEYYVVSKKCEWLVCENHHGQLIASGEPMASKLAKMANR